MAAIVQNGEAGLVLMHVRGKFETIHEKVIEGDIINEVAEDLRWSLKTAKNAGIDAGRICLDVGIGFGKTQKQNLRLLAQLPKLVAMFPGNPMLVGVSRKSFIGKIVGEPDASHRLAGTIAANCAAVAGGANILRVHDVKATVDAVKVMCAVNNEI
jgi:dihydropteroate synthase